MTKKNLTRKHLVNKIYQNLGFSKNTSSSLVDDFFESLISELTDSKNVKISSFGTFKVMNKKERIGRNPKTKVSAKITARKVVKFKPSLLLKSKLNKHES
jgi:integration host factor subunit alpha